MTEYRVAIVKNGKPFIKEVRSGLEADALSLASEWSTQTNADEVWVESRTVSGWVKVNDDATV